MGNKLSWSVCFLVLFCCVSCFTLVSLSCFSPCLVKFPSCVITNRHKQALKIMDQKPTRWHHGQIGKKHNLLGFDSFVNFSFLKFIFKCVNNLAPEILGQLINKLNSRIRTRGGTSGNCRTAKRKTTFGQSSFVAIGTKLWNTLPSEIKTLTALKVFNTQVKQWLKLNKPCEH